jgi:hypothetical protein
MKKQIKVSVMYCYSLTIDADNPIVRDYANEKEMVQHLVDYRFNDVLPVLSASAGGVKVEDVQIEEWSITK